MLLPLLGLLVGVLLGLVLNVNVGFELSRYSAVGLGVVVTDANGFMLETRPKGWSAVFGFYTPSLRTTDLIPEQVRLLRSLLVGREQTVDRVILASETDGTYTQRASPSAAPSKAP